MKAQQTNLMKRVLASLLLCGIMVFWGLQVSAQEWTDAQKEVWKTTETFWKNMMLGDADAINDAITALGTKGSLEWWPTQKKPNDANAVKEEYKRWFEYDKPVTYKLEPLNIFILNNTANIFYLYQWKGKVLSDNGRIMETWIKQDNKWKFMGAMGCSCKKALTCK